MNCMWNVTGYQGQLNDERPFCSIHCTMCLLHVVRNCKKKARFPPDFYTSGTMEIISHTT